MTVYVRKQATDGLTITLITKHIRYVALVEETHNAFICPSDLHHLSTQKQSYKFKCTRTMVEQFQINRSNFKIKSETGKRPSKLVVNQTLNMRNVIHNKLKSLTLDSQQSKSGYNVFICKQQCIKTTNRQNQRQTDRNTEGSTYIAPRKQHPSAGCNWVKMDLEQ